jgi:hypothetical protein
MAADEHTQLWIDALRSGKYKQGAGFLRQRGAKYCCLGVACEVYNRNVPKAKRLPVNVSLTTTVGITYYGDHGTTMPNVVAAWYGMSTTDILPQTILAGKNDSGETFTAIADYIESQPKGLFGASG